MKMDIEGSELEVIHDLILTGSFQHIDYIMIEWHKWINGIEKRKEIIKQESLPYLYTSEGFERAIIHNNYYDWIY